jgi:hypothetical protein
LGVSPDEKFDMRSRAEHHTNPLSIPPHLYRSRHAGLVPASSNNMVLSPIHLLSIIKAAINASFGRVGLCPCGATPTFPLNVATAPSQYQSTYNDAAIPDSFRYPVVPPRSAVITRALRQGIFTHHNPERHLNHNRATKIFTSRSKYNHS